MPQAGTLEDLGNMVKQKYPAYQDMDSAQLGQLIQKKYPGSYDDFTPAQSSSLPDDPGAPDAIQPKPVSIPGPGAGSPSGSGFGTSGMTLPPPPPLPHQGLFQPNFAQQRAVLDYTNWAQAQTQTQEKRQEALDEQNRRDAMVDRMIASGVKLPKREEAILRSGTQISPERAPFYGGTVTYAELTPQEKADNPGINTAPTAAFQRKIDPESGRAILNEIMPQTSRRLESDPDSKKTGWSLVTRDKTGNVISKAVDQVNPMTLPRITSTISTGQVITQVQDPDDPSKLIVIQGPETRSGQNTVTPVMPGQQSAPATPSAPVLPPYPGAPKPVRPAAAPGSASAAAPDNGGLPPGFRKLGVAPKTYTMEMDQNLSPVAQGIVLKTQPQIAMLGRLQEQLKPYKDSRTPMTTFLPRLAYAMGFTGGDAVDQLLSNLEMTGITSASSALAGSTRARNFITDARLHTAQAWTDSGPLMYNKVGEIKQRLQAIVDEARGPEGQKHPGLTPPPAANSRPPLDSFHR